MTSGGVGGCGSENYKGSISNMEREREREKTKLRERRRRSITTKIFEGLRKHGGYNLPPRADINDVLRALAREAGWVVDPDGTTYRQPNCREWRQVSPPSLLKHHSACVVVGGGRNRGTPTPTSSLGGALASSTSLPRNDELASYLAFGGAHFTVAGPTLYALPYQ